MAKTVVGVELNNNTVLSNFHEIYENEEQVTEKLAKLWLEWNSTTTQKALNKANGDIKDVKPVEFSQ